MKSPIWFAAVLLVIHGCAGTPERAAKLASGEAAESAQGACGTPQASDCGRLFAEINEVSPIILKATRTVASTDALAHGAEVQGNDHAAVLEGRPLTSVVVTQCNLVVAVYMTMRDGRLLRFDQRAEVPAQELVTIAYTAARSERVEVACEGLGAAGFETHDSV